MGHAGQRCQLEAEIRQQLLAMPLTFDEQIDVEAALHVMMTSGHPRKTQPAGPARADRTTRPVRRQDRRRGL